MKDSEFAVREVLDDKKLVSTLLTDDAKFCMRKNYAARIEKVYMNPIITEIKKALKNYDFEESVTLAGKNLEALNRAAQDVRIITNDYSLEYFRKKYSPILCEYECNIKRNFIDGMREFLERLSESINSISRELFDGKAIRKITGLSSDAADVHRHGRVVLCVKSDVGNFYYKPHDCGLDSFYYELISSYFSDCTCAAKVVEGRGYGFVSEIVQKELKCLEDVGKYYYNFGILTAIFHGLGSTDMHQENIIACGVKPSVADIETIISAKVATSRKKDKSYIDYEISNSVCSTHVFPVRPHKGPMLSTLHCMEDKFQNTPKFKGVRYNIVGHEEEFIAGFKEGYNRMINIREEIKHMFSKRKNIVVRHVMRNTTYYSIVLSYLFRAESMTSFEAREKILAKLVAPYRIFKEKLARESAVAYERACVIQGDIPYYCLYSSGYDLCGEDVNEVIQKNVNPEEMLSKKLDALNEKECKFEEDTIRNILTYVPYDSNEYDERIQLSVKAADVDALREIAATTFQNLSRSIIHIPNGFFMWFSIASSMNSVIPVHFCMRRGEAGFYSAKILSIPEFSKFHKEANDILQNSLEATSRYADQWERNKDMLKGSTGLYVGISGLLSLLGKVADLGIQNAKEIINRILILIDEHILYRDQETWIVYGVSGLIVALAELKHNGHTNSFADKIDKILNNCAEYLYEYDTDLEAVGPNGLDGIGAAFAEAYSCTENESFAEQSIKLFRKVRENYSEHLVGWIESDTPVKWLAKKSSWIGGILYNSLTASKVLKNYNGAEIVNEVRDLALNNLCSEDKLLPLDSLYGGNALSVTALLKAYKQLSNSDCLEKAGQILSGMLKRYSEHGAFNATPKGITSFFDPSLFFGTLGIACTMLEYISVIEHGRYN